MRRQSPHKKPLEIGSSSYREGAQERIQDALVLLKQGRLTLSVYAAGCAVEGMLRSLIASNSREFDERHDLRKFAVRVRDLGLLESELDHGFVADVEGVARAWHNLLRFVDEAKLERHYRRIGEFGKRDTLKFVAARHWTKCNRVVKRCGVLWQRSRQRN
ncbi:MAG: HEPN domain-containing protein [Phycisphaerales bacterium]|nr:HEPN domain-containing protein [Phycisphaerales bacterium]